MRWRSLAVVAMLLHAVEAPGAPAFRGGALDPPRPAPELTLQDAEGREFRLSRQRGQVVVMALPEGPREVTYVIPKGTAVRQSLGVNPRVLPDVMRFTLGVRDVLVLRNEDDVAATLGPVRLEPGQTYRVPFRTPTTIQLACSVHREGAIGIIVKAPPAAGWERLRWRARNLVDG